MEFNFFRKKEVAPKADNLVDLENATEKIEEVDEMTKEGERQAGNETTELEKVKARDPKGKKNKTAIIAVLSLLTIFSAMSATSCTRMQNKVIIDEIERSFLGDTAENIRRRNNARDHDLLGAEKDEASEIRRRKDMNVHQKKEAIHKAYQRRVKVN